MVRFLRRTVVLAVSAVLLAGVSGVTPAAAGGVTSVLLSAAGIGKVAAVGYSDTAYAELNQLVLATAESTASQPPTSELDKPGRVVTATWMLHDRTVWRWDTFYLDTAGGPWIATIQMLGDRPPGADPDQKPTWHRSSQPANLIEVLGRLGLLGDRPGEPTVTPGPGIFYVAARTLAGGRAEGVASSLGTGLGGMVHVLAGSVGVSAIVLASAELFTALKLIGAAYLIWLGFRTFQSARRDASAGSDGRSVAPPIGPRRAFREGVLVEALNPPRSAGRLLAVVVREVGDGGVVGR